MQNINPKMGYIKIYESNGYVYSANRIIVKTYLEQMHTLDFWYNQNSMRGTDVHCSVIQKTFVAGLL